MARRGFDTHRRGVYVFFNASCIFCQILEDKKYMSFLPQLHTHTLEYVVVLRPVIAKYWPAVVFVSYCTEIKWTIFHLIVPQSIIFVEKKASQFDLHCRVNADEEDEERDALDYLWTNLAPFIRALEKQLRQWPGLQRKVRWPAPSHCLHQS